MPDHFLLGGIARPLRAAEVNEFLSLCVMEVGAVGRVMEPIVGTSAKRGKGTLSVLFGVAHPVNLNFSSKLSSGDLSSICHMNNSEIYQQYVAHKLQLAEQLSQGQCGGTYTDACIIVASLLSGIAADIWPGKSKDRRRFVEVWVRYGGTDPLAVRVSLPLLVRKLEKQNRLDAAGRVKSLRPDSFKAANGDSVLLGSEIDATESEVLKACPDLNLREIRDRSYPVVFYEHVRSTLVHEYELSNRASGIKLTNRRDSVSYTNVLVGEIDKKQIHFHMDWIISFVRRVASVAADDVTGSGNREDPVPWWAEGKVLG